MVNKKFRCSTLILVISVKSPFRSSKVASTLLDHEEVTLSDQYCSLASGYDKVEIPRFKYRFDVWAPSLLVPQDQPTSYTIVTRDTDDVKGKSFVARLHYDHLGFGSTVQKLVSSKSSRHRTLYVGEIPH